MSSDYDDREEMRNIVKEMAILCKRLGWEFSLISEDYYGSDDETAQVSAFIIRSLESSFDPDIAAEQQDLAIDIFEEGEITH